MEVENQTCFLSTFSTLEPCGWWGRKDGEGSLAQFVELFDCTAPGKYWHQVSWQMCCSWGALGAKDPSLALSAALPGLVEVVSKGREAQWVLVMGAKRRFHPQILWYHIMRSLPKGWMSGRCAEGWDPLWCASTASLAQVWMQGMQASALLSASLKKQNKNQLLVEKGKIVECCFPSAVGCLGFVPWLGWACVR